MTLKIAAVDSTVSYQIHLHLAYPSLPHATTEDHAFYKCACPFHDGVPRHPENLHVRRGNGTFHCVFCGAGGYVEALSFSKDLTEATAQIRRTR